MSRHRTEAAVMRAIGEQAAEWFVVHRDNSLTTEQRRQFLNWLQTSPLHVSEYLSVARMSIGLRTVARQAPQTAEDLIAAAHEQPINNVIALPTKHSAPLRTPRKLAALAASVVVVAISAATWWSMARTPQHAEFRTAHGEQRTVRLEDGSVLHINSDSQVRVDFSDQERHVYVDLGQALFSVAKDKTRPFRVRAGDTEVVAVGTEFDVRRTDDNVVVTVVEGQVAVTQLARSVTTDTNADAASVRLAAGQQARVVQGAVPTVRKAVDVRPAVAWVQQRILFERQTLAEVIAEFNRYGTTQMVIEDSEIAHLRISGMFNAYDLESFVLYLENVNGLVVQRDVDRIRISVTRHQDGERT